MSQSQKRKVKETSPVFPVWDKKHRTMDPLLKEMMEKMEKNLLAQMKLSEGIINQNIDSKLQVLEKSIDSRLVKIDEELKVLQEENQALRDDNTRLSAKLGIFDRDKRRNNVIISGLEATNPEEAVTIVNKALKATGVEPTPLIMNVRILRLKSGQKIVGSFQSLEEKRAIMRNKRNIKTADGNPVYIDDDLSPEDSQIQFRVRQKAKEWRAAGKDVKIGSGQIKVDGTWWKYDAATGDISKKVDYNKKDF